MYGDLPSDVTRQDETLGPPPPWWGYSRTLSVDPTQLWYYPQGTSAFFGDHDFDPVQKMRLLKRKQEWDKRIPKVVDRYTTINPMSPLFRNKKKHYGYGNLEEVECKSLITSLLGGLTTGYLNEKFGYSINPLLAISLGATLGFFTGKSVF